MNLSETIHGLWIKGKLSPLELLTIHSYTSNGYRFILWVYDQKDLYPSIAQLEVRDAAEIIPLEKVFCYKYSNQFGHGKGSYAGFSDIFRYKLLYEKGGWWTDMDVTSLRKFSFPSEYVFRTSKEREESIVGNIMHVPAKSELMLRCYEQAVEQVNENSRDWMLPIRILNDNIKALGLNNYVYSFSNEDSWPSLSRLVISSPEIPAHWQAIHWMNEEFRRLNIAKEFYTESSFLGKCMQAHQLAKPIKGFWNIAKYRFKVSRWYYAFLHLRRETIWQSIYYLAYNLFYAISDLYFVTIKPHFDIGKIWRGFWSKFFPAKS